MVNFAYRRDFIRFVKLYGFKKDKCGCIRYSFKDGYAINVDDAYGSIQIEVYQYNIDPCRSISCRSIENISDYNGFKKDVEEDLKIVARKNKINKLLSI